MATSIGQYTPVVLPGEPHLWQRSLAGHSLQGRRVWHNQSGPARIDKIFACGSSAQWELSVKVVQLLGLWGPWWRRVQGHRLPPPQELRPYQSLFPSLCSWWSEGLFGQSFSVAPPVQALRGLPCLGFFSVVPQVWHIEGAPLAGVLLCRLAHQVLKGAPWAGSYSVVQRVRHLMGQPPYCSAALLACGEREAMVMAPIPMRDSAVSIALLPWLSGFPSPAFPTTIFSLSSPQSISPQTTGALALGLLHSS